MIKRATLVQKNNLDVIQAIENIVKGIKNEPILTKKDFNNEFYLVSIEFQTQEDFDYFEKERLKINLRMDFI